MAYFSKKGVTTDQFLDWHYHTLSHDETQPESMGHLHGKLQSEGSPDIFDKIQWATMKCGGIYRTRRKEMREKSTGKGLVRKNLAGKSTFFIKPSHKINIQYI
jgi:hypothetical protein